MSDSIPSEDRETISNLGGARLILISLIFCLRVEWANLFVEKEDIPVVKSLNIFSILQN